MTVTADLDHVEMVVGGEPVDSVSGETMQVLNPATNAPYATVPRAVEADVDRAVAAAEKAFPSWSRTAPGKRTALMMRFAQLMQDRSEELERAESIDSGKPVMFAARPELAHSIEVMTFYAGATSKLTGETVPTSPHMFTYTLREPLGVCGQIIPWNYPLMMAVWKIAPAIAAGNTVILKPASNTPITALMLARLALEAGIPAGVVNVITGPGAKIGAYLAGHPSVAKVAFTGETATGRTIMSIASQTMKRVTLELGGKSANIVFEDANLEDAVNGSLFAIYYNAGQSCEARSRLLIQRSVYDAFVERFAAKTARIKVGDPLDPATQVGAIISPSQLESIERYVEIGEEEGATVVAGGKRPEDPTLAGGNFLLPTALANADNSMRVAQEEIFGPVVVMIPFDTEEEAIALANDSIYGLAGTVWTQNLARAHRVVAGVQTGLIGVNTPATGTPGIPFGGFKQSGIGRELSFEALKQYTEIKGVLINTSSRPVNPWRL
ncbi:MAG TPA: aldehyde dehydrogenase family protein [Chloroflexota bacterium]|nr:aldehyde dehydrogenase family protein [Chloroflexota bacterium]